MESPIGALGLAATDGVLTGVSFRGAPASEITAMAELERGDLALLQQARDQLKEYFAGERLTFDLPYRLTGGSQFEQVVWAQIAAIPYGETMSYGAIARAVGEPQGAQAVGTACNHNPLPIVVACHRVIGSDGKLVGFGGGLGRKRFLLGLEARVHIEHTFAP